MGNETSRPIQVGLIGCGRATAALHLPALRHVPEVEVVALADVDPSRRRQVAERFGVERVYPGHADLLADETIEAVGVCVPAAQHLEVGLAALDAGKHLLLEKPIALSLGEADRLIDRAGRSSRKAILGFNLRWHRLVQRTRAMLARGVIGNPTLLRAALTSYHEVIPDWRIRRASGGGVFFEQAVHHFDLWRYLLGSDVEQVFAAGRSGKWEDEAAALTARMSNGVLVTAVFAEQTAGRNEVEVFGPSGSLSFSFDRFDSLVHAAGGEPRESLGLRARELWRTAREMPPGFLRLRHGGDFLGTYQAEWRQLFAAIRHDAPIECTLEDGRRALQVVLAAAKSTSTGRPVDVAEVA